MASADEPFEWWDTRQRRPQRQEGRDVSASLFVSTLFVNGSQAALFGVVAGTARSWGMAAAVAASVPLLLVGLAGFGWAVGGRSGRALVIGALIVGLSWTPAMLALFSLVVAVGLA